MADKLYDYMDWPRIEAVVYGEESLPREILGPRPVKGGILVQCFFLGARNIKVHVMNKNRNYKMTMEEESGYFAALIPGKEIPEYEYLVDWEDGGKSTHQDPYMFGSMLDRKKEELFCDGLDYEVYRHLGAHPMRRKGVKGVYFAIWAPNALRVSVVGDFNNWDGRRHPMHKSGGSGIYELFLPDAKPGDLYKYEIMVKGGATFLKADPYAFSRENAGENACIVPAAKKYAWKDTEWMKEHPYPGTADAPLSICEVNLGEWAQEGETYREIGERVAAYVRELGYTHVELAPVMEYDGDNCYDTVSYYTPSARLGTPEDFKAFIEILHGHKVGVILDWTAAHFPKVEEGLQVLDGTRLYEYEDVKKRIHPMWGTLIFNYDSPMVRNFLIANALFWIKEFHADGLRLDDVDCMLYLDYGREEGQWTPNIYGTNENLEAIEFIKHLNSVVKKQEPYALMIAQEDGLWPSLTGAVDEEHMGFDYKWNNGWTDSFLNYLHMDPIYRGGHHDELTVSMVYAYCENYVLTLNSRDVCDVSCFMESIPGSDADKFATWKAACGYLMAHPGKMMLTGDEKLSDDGKEYLRELLTLYKTRPAFYKLDTDPDGFAWIQLMEAQKNILVFMRKTEKVEETMLVVCNFSAVAYDKYQIGVPYKGKYKEIFNSDHLDFGGSGCVNPRIKTCKAEECDEREYSITVKVAPLSVSIYEYRPVK